MNSVEFLNMYLFHMYIYVMNKYKCKHIVEHTSHISRLLHMNWQDF